MKNILQWWSEGEVGAKVVYRQSLTGFLITFALSMAIMVLLPAMRTWYSVLVCACVTGRALIERRRAFIFTDSSLVYRPAFGSVRRIKFADINSIEKTTASVSFWFQSRQFRGFRVQLKNREEIVIPLDFPQAHTISEQFLLNVIH